MKTHYIAASLLALASTIGAITSCENDNINPYDYNRTTTDSTNTGSKEVVATQLAEYPIGSLVWTKDTLLTESVEIPQGTSLYIEPGVTVTCSSQSKVPIELVVLGNLYCMGTEQQPVVFTSDNKKPNDWGGIICGYNSEEVVLSHTEIAYGGATPTESSFSFQNQLFKTTIDGGVPAFHFCNVNGKLVMDHCFLHDNYNDQIYLTGGKGIITHSVFADNGNAADGGDAINVKSGCRLDVAYNLIYNACTNAFKLSNSGNDETHPLTEMTVYNNTMVNCGWRRSKNKKGGSIWLEKSIFPTLVNNLVYDCRYGMKQPQKDGCLVEQSLLTPNYFFASTTVGLEQMSEGADLIMLFDKDIRSQAAGDKNPLFTSFTQNPLINVNCEVDDAAQGAPLAYDKGWNFAPQEGSLALQGGVTNFEQMFPTGLAFFGVKKINWLDTANDCNYYYTAPAPQAKFGAY